jgi:Tol biopolymer transport system component
MLIETKWGRRQFARGLAACAGSLPLGCNAAVGEPRRRRNAVFSIQLDGLTGLRDTLAQLSPRGYFIQPMLDAAGASVLYWGRGEGEEGFNIWRHDLAERRSVKVTERRGLTGHPFWRADAQGFVCFSNEGVSDEADWSMDNQFEPDRSPRNLWLMARDGSGSRRLTEGAFVDERPCLSPDGQTAVFVSSRSGRLNLWCVSLATGELRQVTRHDGFDYRPVFSPDGKRLAFFTTNSPNGIHDLCIMSWPDGAVSYPVRKGAFKWIHGPFWCADGQSLLIHAVAAGENRYALWLLSLSDGRFDRLVLPGLSAYAHGSLNADRTLLIFDSAGAMPP